MGSARRQLDCLSGCRLVWPHPEMETVGTKAQLADQLGRALSCQAFIDQGEILFNPSIVVLAFESY